MIFRCLTYTRTQTQILAGAYCFALYKTTIGLQLGVHAPTRNVIVHACHLYLIRGVARVESLLRQHYRCTQSVLEKFGAMPTFVKTMPISALTSYLTTTMPCIGYQRLHLWIGDREFFDHIIMYHSTVCLYLAVVFL